MTTPTPQEVNPGIPADKFPSYRPWQWQGVQDVVEAVRTGIKVVFVDADTGAGKSLLAESVRSVAMPAASTPYLCTTLTLQDQLEADFPYAKKLKGRANYPTRHYESMYPQLTPEDCNSSRERIDDSNVPEWIQDDVRVFGLPRLTRQDKDGQRWANRCEFCSVQPLCPYIVARDEAVEAPLCITNTSYYLREANGPGRLSNRPLVIVDEADEFFGKILDTFTVSVPKYLLDDPSCPIPVTASKEEDIENWIDGMIVFLQHQSEMLTGSKQRHIEEMGAKKYRRRVNAIDSLLTNFTIASEDEGTWVYEGPSSKSRKKYYKAELRPVWVGDWVNEFVWDHANQWILMSASFVNIDLTAQQLGLKAGEYAKVKIDYHFPSERKPVRFWPSKLPYTRKFEKEGFDAMGDAARKVQTILDWYPTERILVHTVSHKRTEILSDALSSSERPIVVFSGGGAETREERIAEYLETPNAVLLGAGLERGYDFKYDDCRVVVLAKTPFADFGDPVVALRTNSGIVGQAWYDLSTVRSTVQAIGRGMRAEDDWLVTYLLDKSFNKYLRGPGKKYMPESFLASLKLGRPLGRETIG